MDTRSLMRRYLALILLFVVLAIMVVANLVAGSNHSHDLGLQSARIAQLKSQIDVAKTAGKSEETTLNIEASGFDHNRKSKDDDIARDLLSTATTWSSHAQYVTAREKIKRKYHLSEDSPLMKSFLPVVKSVKSSNGTEYNMIDTYHRAASFRNLRSTVSNIDKSNYSYVAIMSVKTTNASGSSMTYDVVTYTVDPNGVLTNPVVTPISGVPAGASL